MAFLDEKGLSRFWEKIKDRFSFTTDSSLTETDGVLGVTTPVKDILTREEYDALPEEEKIRGAYFIDEGVSGGGNIGGSGSSGAGMDVYDGEERVIGTWFGKPLYERVFSFVSPSSHSSTSSSVVKTLDDNISPVTVESYLKFDDFTINPLPFFASTTEYVVLFIEANNVYMRVSSKAYVSTNGYMIIRYTKTTD